MGAGGGGAREGGSGACVGRGGVRHADDTLDDLDAVAEEYECEFCAAVIGKDKER